MALTPNEFRSLLGDFWNRLWKDRGLVEGVIAANAAATAQTAEEVAAMDELLGRLSIDPRRRRPWKLLSFPEEDISKAAVKIGDSTVGGFRVGDTLWPEAWMLNAIPDGLEGVEALADDPANPSIWWHNGQDFILDNGAIVFPVNPFDVFDARLEGDSRVVSIWMAWPALAEGDLADYFGKLIGLSVGDSNAWKDKLNAVWDCLCQGCTVENINAFMAAMAGDDVAPTGGKVDKVWTEGGKWVVAVDGVIASSMANQPVVREGDEVSKGAILFDGVVVETLETVPDDIYGLVLPTEAGELLFPNAEYEVEAMET